MSYLTNGIPGSGPGSGTVTSIAFSGGLTSVPNPVTTIGTATLDQTNLTVQDGTVYWDTGTQRLNTTATGSATFVLTSNGAGSPPTYQAVSASGAVTSVSGGNNITITGTATAPIVNVSGTTNHYVQVGNATGSLTSVSPSIANFVLTSNGVGSDPSFQTVSASGAVTTLTGNSGGAISPTAGNINILTANSTAKFVGAGSTLTLDFSLSNLILGNNGSTITIGAANDGFGSGVLQSITSGSSNTAMGNASLQNVTIGSQTTAYGASSGTAINTGGNNTLIGFQSGLLLQSGNSNVALGYQSGSAWGAAVSNNIAIGTIASVADSARIRIGQNGVQTSTFIVGIDGVNVGSVAKVVTMASDQLGTATITAGTGISVVAGANTITINAVGGGDTWSVITANQTAAVNNGYFCNKAGTLALALPAVSAIGDVIEVANINTATGVQFTQAAGQQIFIGNTSTTLGAAGTLTSSAVGDTLKIVCRTANTIWQVTSMMGNWTPA